MARHLERLTPDALSATMSARPGLVGATSESIDAFDDWVGVATEKRKRVRTKPSQSLKRAVEAVESLYERSREEGEEAWRDAKPQHLVGLYARLHLMVYDVLPFELEGDAFMGAVSAARKMLSVEFDGDVLRMLEFMRWVWDRERFREGMRRRKAEDNGFRLGWRLQFANRSLYTDWRTALVRAASKRGR
jgi:hypothetical protein